MYSIFIGSLLLSLFHAVIPNHWLPVLAIGKKDNWTLQEVTRVTFISGLAHALSTVAIGIILGVLGLQLANKIEYFIHFIAPAVFILSGSFFIYQHHRHKHFHLHKTPRPTLPKNKIILALVVAMFLSPCMENRSIFSFGRCIRFMGCYRHCSFISYHINFRNGIVGKACLQRNFEIKLAYT